MATSSMTSTATAETRQRPWWLSLIVGIFSVIVGAILLFAPMMTKVNTWMFLVVVLGIYWLILGIMDIVSIFVDHTMWGWKLFIGIVSIIAGGWILIYPAAAAIALPQIFVLVLGIWAFVYGLVLLFMAFQGGGWGAGVLGVLGIILGIDLMANYAAPGMGLSLLWAAAIFALVGGVVMIIHAFQRRSA